ncbi:hypothetical protein SprV_0200531200 [Sparganum proliferum]
MYVHFEAVEDACSSAFVSQCTRLSFFGSFCFLASRRGDSTLLTKLSFCHVPLHSKRRQGVSPGSVMANVLYLNKTELPPNLLRDTPPQPGETLIFKGITYWQPALLLSFRPANFFKRTNFSCLYFIPTTTRIPKIEWFFLHSNSELSVIPSHDPLNQHNISTEELPCPSELLDGLHGIYEEDDFYGIRNRCFRSVLTLNYRALGQDGEYVCQVTAQEGVDVEMPIRFHFPLGYPLERLVHPRLGEGEASTCVSETLNAAHNLSRRDLANRLNACPKNALLLSWLSSNSICTGQAVELNCAWPAWQETSTNYLRMYSLSDFQTDAQLLD